MSTTQVAPDASPDLDVVIGARVHQLMFLKRLSQTKMAPLMGIGQGVLSRKLRGEVAWFARDLMNAAAVLGVQVTDLLPETTNGPVDDGAVVSELPRLDSNQQPAGYLSSQVSGLHLVAEYSDPATSRRRYVAAPAELIDLAAERARRTS